MVLVAHLDLWLKEIAPSNEARKAFDHVPERFALFAKKYQQELSFEEEKTRAVSELIQLMHKLDEFGNSSRLFFFKRQFLLIFLCK